MRKSESLSNTERVLAIPKEERHAAVRECLGRQATPPARL
jgi:hypothetical protein